MAPTSPPPPPLPLSNRTVPTYTIDLASPPHLRYLQLARDYGERMRALRHLFDELLSLLFPAPALRRSVKLLARATLRRLHSDEETREIRSIARAAGVELYLLVVLNTILDYLLGCTSGAVRVRSTPLPAKGGRGGGTPPPPPARLMHFRTLDWGMDQLRDLLVVLEFVDSSSSPVGPGPGPGRVLARSVTYAGFVGTLTAVREDMSLSMNFRPNHACATRSLWFHRFLVLIGRRSSLPSVLRSFILEGVVSPPSSPPPRKGGGALRKSPPKPGTAATPERRSSRRPSQSLRDQAKRLAAARCSPCYIILCDGAEVVAIEKDLFTGTIRSSTDFLVHTNHDVHEAEPSSSSNPDEIPGATMHPKNATRTVTDVKSGPLRALEAWLEESTSRMDSVANKWKRHAEKVKTKVKTKAKKETMMTKTHHLRQNHDRCPPPPPTLQQQDENSSIRSSRSRLLRIDRNGGDGNGNGNAVVGYDDERNNDHTCGSSRRRKGEEEDNDDEDDDDDRPSISLATLKRWIQADPVTNPCTHFACILDPKMGEVRWIEILDAPGDGDAVEDEGDDDED